MEVLLSQPRGFCAGVVRAVAIVELALEVHGAPVYVFHQIVHNRHVVEDLAARGAIFVERLRDVPVGSITVFSAHGVSSSVILQAEKRKLQVVDATCPLVTKVHLQAQRYHAEGYELIIIGHAGHQEVEGTRGRVSGEVHVVSTIDDAARIRVRHPGRVAYVTQTTLSIDDTRNVIDALRTRFPSIKGPSLDNICYATQNRQNAVRNLSQSVDLLLVVGAHNSSNSNRLRETGEQCGVVAHLIEDEHEIDPDWFKGVACVGVTAGASTPEHSVQRVLEKIRDLGGDTVRTMGGAPERMTFRLPVELRNLREAQGWARRA